MNIQSMLMQAKKMQSNLEKISNEINVKEFIIDNDNLYINMLGDYKLKSFKIKNSELIIDKELLEEVIEVSLNDILTRIKKEKDEKLGKYTNGLGGLF